MDKLRSDRMNFESNSRFARLWAYWTFAVTSAPPITVALLYYGRASVVPWYYAVAQAVPDADAPSIWVESTSSRRRQAARASGVLRGLTSPV